MKRRFFMREGNVGELRRAGTFCGGSCLLFPRVIAAAVAFSQCDDPLKKTRVARFYCAEFFACHKKRLCSDVLLSDTASFREFVGRCELQREFFMPKKWRRRGTHRHKCRIPRKLRGRLNTFRLQRLHLLRIRRCKCRMRCSHR